MLPDRRFEFLRSEWRFLLFGLLTAFWSSPGQTFLISLFSAELRAEFSLSHSGFSGIYTLATLTSAAILWKAGQMIDRLPLAKFVWWTTAAMSAATAAFSLVTGPVTLFFGILAVRFLGQGMMSHIALTAMARRYTRTRGTALAIASMGFPLGEAMFPVLLIAALPLFDWRILWVFMGLAAAVTMLPAISLLLRRTASQDGHGAETLEQEGEAERHWDRSEMLRDRRFYLIAPLPIAHSAIGTGIFFHQVHIVATKGWNLEWWAVCFVIYAAAQVLGNLASGRLVDRFSARRMVPFILLPLAAALVFLAIFDDALWAAVIMGLIGLSSGANNPVISSLWAEFYGTRHLGSIRSVAAVMMVFGSALGPVFMGWAIDGGITLGAIAVTSAVIIVVANGLAAFSVLSEPVRP